MNLKWKFQAESKLDLAQLTSHPEKKAIISLT